MVDISIAIFEYSGVSIGWLPLFQIRLIHIWHNLSSLCPQKILKVVSPILRQTQTSPWLYTVLDTSMLYIYIYICICSYSHSLTVIVSRFDCLLETQRPAVAVVVQSINLTRPSSSQYAVVRGGRYTESNQMSDCPATWASGHRDNSKILPHGSQRNNFMGMQ